MSNSSRTNTNTQDAGQVETLDQVEVLDNGVRLGWADLVNGQWSYPVSGLSVGGHSLTGRYMGEISPPWTFIIADKVDVDDFEDAPEGSFFWLPRPLYQIIGSYEETPGSWGFNTKEIVDHPEVLPGIAGKKLIVGIRTNLNNSTLRTLEIDLIFNASYSVVSFACQLYYYRNVADHRVDAMTEQDVVVASEDFTRWPSDTVRDFTLGVRGSKIIKKLRFKMSISPQDAISGAQVKLDNLRMTP